MKYKEITLNFIIKLKLNKQLIYYAQNLQNIMANYSLATALKVLILGGRPC